MWPTRRRRLHRLSSSAQVAASPSGWQCATAPGRVLLLLTEQRAALEPADLAGSGLTPREAEVIALVSRGLTNAAVAQLLGVRRKTVEKHLEHIFDKLGVETRTAAVAWAFDGITRVTSKKLRPLV